MKDFKDLIHENPNALESEICEEIILKFKRDERKAPGITTSGEVLLDVKKSIDLNISILNDWKDIDQILFDSLKIEIDKYNKKLEKFLNIAFWSNKIKDDGYNVKEYKPGDYYNWHVDAFTHPDGWTRTIACIWYLNEVEEGGETEFGCGYKVTPSKGKLVLFPASWNYPHRGLSPIKGNKYIITSFIMSNDNPEEHFYES